MKTGIESDTLEPLRVHPDSDGEQRCVLVGNLFIQVDRLPGDVAAVVADGDYPTFWPSSMANMDDGEITFMRVTGRHLAKKLAETAGQERSDEHDG